MSYPQPATTILPHPGLASTLSTSDAAALERFTDASQARAWTLHRVAECKEYTSTLLAIHNSIAPIHKLPTEILRMVFAYVCHHRDGRPSWRFASWMLSLQSVSRRWRSVLLATPEYWVHGIGHVVDLYHSNEGLLSDSDDEYDDYDGGGDDDDRSTVLGLFLTKSAPCPLELIFDYTTGDNCPGWKAFKNHFGRVTVFEVFATDKVDLQENILRTMATKMNRLERFHLGEIYFGVSKESLDQWESQNLPRLGHLTIPSMLFCCATTVSSLHTIILEGERDVESLPDLLDALERCPALAMLSLGLTLDRRRDSHSGLGRTPQRIVDLQNIRRLEVKGTTSDMYRFLSSISFPSLSLLDLDVLGIVTNDEVFSGTVFLNALPRRHSVLYASPSVVDRLCLRPETHWNRTCLFMHCFVQGEERLRVRRALSLRSADQLLQFLDAFSACTLTELALDLRYHTNYVDPALWARFFAALPDLRRLELLSTTADSRAMKRTMAEQFLAASRRPAALSLEARGGGSLAWVVHAGESSPTQSQLEEELGDVEQVVCGYSHLGTRLEHLEIYVAVQEPYDYTRGVVDVMGIKTNGPGSRLVTRAYVSRLEEAVNVVIIGGGWGFAEDGRERA